MKKMNSLALFILAINLQAQVILISQNSPTPANWSTQEHILDIDTSSMDLGWTDG